MVCKFREVRLLSITMVGKSGIVETLPGTRLKKPKLDFYHPKIPLGIGLRVWKHGKLAIDKDIYLIYYIFNKIYIFYNIVGLINIYSVGGRRRW